MIINNINYVNLQLGKKCILSHFRRNRKMFVPLMFRNIFLGGIWESRIHSLDRKIDSIWVKGRVVCCSCKQLDRNIWSVSYVFPFDKSHLQPKHADLNITFFLFFSKYKYLQNNLSLSKIKKNHSYKSFNPFFIT